jgi:hypothetical protein
MATTKTYVLTTGFDQIITGQELILGGVDQGKHVPTGKHKTIILNAGTPGSFNSGDDIEITNLATNNTLNASYVGLDFTEVNPAAFSGIQLLNFTLGEHNVTIDGGTGSNGLALFAGMTTLSLKSSAGGQLDFGGDAPGTGMTVLPTQINASNATAQGSGLEVNIDPTAFPTSPVTVTASFSKVGNPGSHQSDSDDYVHGGSNAFEFSFGANDGSATATTWNLSEANGVFLRLFTHGATTPTTVNVSGSGGMTLFGESFEFANVGTFKDTATGAQVITGALQTDGSSRPDLGFLTDNVALTAGGTLTVSSTSSGNFVDLSGFDSLGTGTFSVGGGTVVLSDDVLLSGSPITQLTNGPTNIGYGGDEGTGPGSDGTINWANLPASANTLTFYHGVENDTGFLTIFNTPNTFTMNLQDEDFHHNDFNITAATPAAGNTFNLDIGSNAGTIGVLGATGGTPNDIEDTWSVLGYSTVNIKLAGADDVHLASSGGFIADSGGFGATTINITGSLVDGTNIEEMHFGNVSGVDLSDFDFFGSIASGTVGNEQARGVTTFDGTINDTAKVFLELGATDAILINAASGHGLDMESPDTSVDDTITVIGSTNNFNLLQGSFGDLTSDGQGFNNNDGVGGLAGKAIITGGNVADHIYDTGGTETINVNNIHTKIFYSQFVLNSDEQDEGFGGSGVYAFGITTSNGDMDNNAGAGPGLATVKGFTPSAANSGWVDFNTDSWGFNGNPGNTNSYLGLVDANLDRVFLNGGTHFANVAILNTTAAPTNPTNDLFAMAFGGVTFGNATQAANALAGATDNFTFTNTLNTGNTIDILVAFELTGNTGVEIADMQIFNQTAGGVTGTAGLDITGHALVKLLGVTLTQIEGSAAGSGSFDVVHFTAA